MGGHAALPSTAASAPSAAATARRRSCWRRRFGRRISSRSSRRLRTTAATTWCFRAARSISPTACPGTSGRAVDVRRRAHRAEGGPRRRDRPERAERQSFGEPVAAGTCRSKTMDAMELRRVSRRATSRCSAIRRTTTYWQHVRRRGAPRGIRDAGVSSHRLVRHAARTARSATSPGCARTRARARARWSAARHRPVDARAADARHDEDRRRRLRPRCRLRSRVADGSTGSTTGSRTSRRTCCRARRCACS